MALRLFKFVIFISLVIMASGSILHTAHMMHSDMQLDHCPYTAQSEVACIQNAGLQIIDSHQLAGTGSLGAVGIILLALFWLIYGNKQNAYVKKRWRLEVVSSEAALLKRGILNPKMH